MYPVDNNFHVAVQNSGMTRARVYLFGPTVDPTDDNDVQTNGTLLKMLPGDTDSNSRIEASGIAWADYHNKEKNLTIGDTVSNQVSFSIINTDHAYTGFNFQRCKIYLDVYYEAGSQWLPCPMGVFIFQTPESTTGDVIYLTGFDMMQDLDIVADSWFNAINWTGGISLSTLFANLATQCGKAYVSDANMVNKDTTFTEAPFTSSGRTYRDILGWIAEMACANAKFDRDGKLALVWFKEAKVSGMTFLKNVDLIGCGVFQMGTGEYTVAAVTGLSVKSINLDNPVSLGTSGSVYNISGNPFMNDATSLAVTTKATPILTQLSALGAYIPVYMTAYMDWSIEAGDIIKVIYKNVTYTVPIFQQYILWKGGRAKVQFYSSGDQVLPVTETKEERDEYRLDKEINERVTFTDLSTGGQTIINGSNIHGGTLTLGGLNDENGVMYVKDAANETMARIDNQGIEVFQQDPNTGLNSVVLAGGYFLMQTGGTTSVFINRYNTGDGYIQVCDDQGNPRALISGGEGVCRSIDINGYHRAQIASDGTVQTRDQYDVLRFDMGTNSCLTGYDSFARERIVADAGNGALHIKNAAVYDVVKLDSYGVETTRDVNVTSRHCEFSAHNNAWYRVMQVSIKENNDGHIGAIIHIDITRDYTNTGNEVHSIDLDLVNGKIGFSEEKSVSSTQLIDKIRYTRSTLSAELYGHIDIHYSSSVANDVTVNFSVASKTGTNLVRYSRIESPTIQNDTPANETVVATHNFIANGHNFTGPVYMNGTLLHS